MYNKVKVVLAADFETTTDREDKVQVWSAESIEVNKTVPADSIHAHHENTLDNFMKYLEALARGGNDIIVYFHNLKFDGSYILDWLTQNDKFHLFGYQSGDEERLLDRDKIVSAYKMPMYNYTYMISDKNVIYSIIIRFGERRIEFRDSLKLLPFPLRKIAKDFKTPHQKLEMDYGHKKPGYQPNEKEMAYIENDVFVLKEALEIVADMAGCEVYEMPMTIGSMAMAEFKKIFKEEHGKKAWDEYFPNQTEEIEKCVDGNYTYDDYIRNSYKGGWCYCSPRWQGKVINQRVIIDYLHGTEWEKKFRRKCNSCGFVYDVNSLYPSMMESESGSFYPIGKGSYSVGGFTQEEQNKMKKGKLYGFLHIRCQFHIKPDHLPCIQIKSSFMYSSTEWLETSDVGGVPNTVDLFLTMVDWELIKEQYDIDNLVIVSHITYNTTKGIFDTYINKWAKIKQTSKGAIRAWAKLMLNNLYGKFSTSPNSSYMVCEYNEDYNKVIRMPVLFIDDDRAVYIPIGAAITSWARNFTIRHAQENFNIFCYADTDSIHCIGSKDMAKGIKEHPTAFCAWKNETDWKEAIFAGQKRYIERVTAEDGEPINKWYYNIKCCGMGSGAKNNLNKWLKSKQKKLRDFKQGLVVPGNLKGHIVSGGTYLREQDFCFR